MKLTREQECITDNKTCSDCEYFMGGGDWDLCCTQKHKDSTLGFLCYEDTKACEKFKEKQ